MNRRLLFFVKIACALLVVLPCDAAIRGATKKEQEEAPTEVTSTTRGLEKAKINSLGGAAGQSVASQSQIRENPTFLRNLALYDYLVQKVQRREAFSPIKDERWGETFESRLEKYDIRERFMEARDDTELYRAIKMLSYARRDTHLPIIALLDGINPLIDRRRPRVPLRFMADYTGNLDGFLDVSSAAFFVSQKGSESSVAEVEVGDWLIEVNGYPLAKFVEFMIANFRMSTIASGYWMWISTALSEYKPLIAQDYYPDPPSVVTYKFRRDPPTPDGDPLEYTITLPYSNSAVNWIGHNPATTKNLPPHWSLVHESRDYRLYQPTADYPHRTILIEWTSFSDLPNLTEKLMRKVQKFGLLDYDVIVDTTISFGGSGAPYLIERFAKSPFQSTWGNVRCSGILGRFATNQLESGADFNWIMDVVIPSCRNGAEYSRNEPFKLDFERVGQDGILDPHPVRFTGNFILLTSPQSGSQVDQFTSMWIDNNIGLSMGMPSGGFSNTWEYEETVTFPTTGTPAIFFQYTIGQTIRPNGEVLEGNPAQPDIPYFLTHDNFQTYFSDMIVAAQEELDKLRL